MKTPLRGALSLILGLVSANLQAQLVKPTITRPESIQSMARSAQGAAIPAFLGERLARVAANYGKTEAQFREICRNNNHLQVSAEGLLRYTCPAPGIMEARAAAAEVAAKVAASAKAPENNLLQAASATFELHSRKGCSKRIYLDFNGHTTSDTRWNREITNSAPIVTPPFSLDATVNENFSQAELDTINQIWRRVTEDYAPFDVDVTTEQPNLEDLRKDSLEDTAFGIRVCIGGSSGGLNWYRTSAGGVAYVGSFVSSSETPAFVFPGNLGNGNPKYVAEAVSHEVGHTLGLYHDGQFITPREISVEYYAGFGNWAPIMGVGYSKEIVQWSKGEYPFANNKEDDLAIIASVVGYREDLVPDQFLSVSKFLTTTNSNFSTSEIIERQTDTDLFAFATGGGAVSLSLEAASPAPNLDATLSLYDSQGVLVQRNNNNASTGALISSVLSPGNYYVSVNGAATGTWGSGFGAYGSIGQYTLRGTVNPVGGTPPIARIAAEPYAVSAAPISVNFLSTGSWDPDGVGATPTLTYDWDFDDGERSSEANPTHIFTLNGYFMVQLRVTDGTGLTSLPVLLPVVVGQGKTLSVGDLTISLYSQSRAGYQLVVWVTVVDQNKRAAGRALVQGEWSGRVTGKVSAFTTARGRVGFLTPVMRGSGETVFTVKSLAADTFVYDKLNNVRDSITYRAR